MPSGPLAFKETDVARALRAASKAGGAFHLRIERRTGDILILPGPGVSEQGAAASPAGDPTDDDLDQELAEWEAQQRG